jgi:ribonuclease P protein subunit RPR2
MAPKNTRKIAKQRIDTLYRIAKETVHTEPERAKRYIQLMRRIAQRTRTHLPLEVRRGICRKCDTVLIQGYNSHTRLKQKREPHIAVTCQNCGNITRLPTGDKIC